MSFRTGRTMCLWRICLAYAVFALALAQEQDERACAANISRPCGMEIIWPPSDGIVLFATDTRESIIYVKLWGDCCQFLRPKHNDSKELHFHFPFLYYDAAASRTNRDATLFEWGYASPLDSDKTSIHYRAMRSPLIASNDHDNLPYDTKGHNGSKEFSIWCFMLIHTSFMVKWFEASHDVSNPEVTWVFEPHLLSNSTIPASSVPLSANTLKFRALGKPSSHFYSIPPRYTT
jgi:hypothetical protein